MARSIINYISEFCSDILRGVGENINDRKEDAVFEERESGIKKAILALIEAEVDDDKIIFLLQKYWDLRFSEAKEYLLQERYYIEEKII